MKGLRSLLGLIDKGNLVWCNLEKNIVRVIWRVKGLFDVMVGYRWF